jgi:uncharacterized Tic20 family protein
MAYCATCKIEVDSSKFCGNCGRSVDGRKKSSSKAKASAEVSADTKNSVGRSAVVHFVPLLLSFITPIFTLGISLLILWLPALIVRKSKKSSDFERKHATNALNYHLSAPLYIVAVGIVQALVIFITLYSTGDSTGAATLMYPFDIIFIIGLYLFSLICYIVGSIYAGMEKVFRYPIAIAFLK